MTAGFEERRRRPWPLLFAVVLIAAFLLVAYLIAQLRRLRHAVGGHGRVPPVRRRPTRPSASRPSGIDAAVTDRYAMPAPQDVEFRSRDPHIPNLVLRAWYIPGRTPAGPTVILVHGVKSCRRDPNVLMPAGMLHKAGFGVLLMDQRDHGDSDDEDLRFAAGTEEYLDVLGAWDWLRRAGRAGGEDRDPRDVVRCRDDRHRRRRGAARPAVWEDSSFADMGEAIRDYLTHEGYPTFLAPGGLFMAKVIAGDDLTSKGPLLEIPNYAGRPLAIVHGDADTLLEPALRRGAARRGAWRRAWTCACSGWCRAWTTRAPSSSSRTRTSLAWWTSSRGPWAVPEPSADMVAAVTIRQPRFDHEVRRDVRIPVRDGLELSANLWLPRARAATEATASP